jgi:hypothetical protein
MAARAAASEREPVACLRVQAMLIQEINRHRNT